ncbi:CAP domain-containing protein [Pelomonas sp. KK5]|uniref:CAP domain-containing protein n=1 Tax=Pelomonas sp. KK5 TaxID=1855730 RepID=UPI00097C72AE|nr:CAP domain-containing protein [Pelomonas sp. KK5]
MRILPSALLALALPWAHADCQPAAEQALAAVNALRARAQVCGGQPMAAAPPLRWNAMLAGSARLFADELAQRGVVTHEGQVSRTLPARLRAAGYRVQRAGENIAAGEQDLDDVLAQWLSSPDHCANLMQPEFQDVGLACTDGGTRYARFWVLHLGATPEQRRDALLRSSPDRSP